MSKLLRRVVCFLTGHTFVYSYYSGSGTVIVRRHCRQCSRKEILPFQGSMSFETIKWLNAEVTHE